MKENYFLVVRFWIAPQAEAQVIGGYSMIYGISSKKDFLSYENNTVLKAKFAKQRAPFEKHMKIDRFSGEVVAHA